MNLFQKVLAPMLTIRWLLVLKMALAEAVLMEKQPNISSIHVNLDT